MLIFDNHLEYGNNDITATQYVPSNFKLNLNQFVSKQDL